MNSMGLDERFFPRPNEYIPEDGYGTQMMQLLKDRNFRLERNHLDLVQEDAMPDIVH
jgi:UDP-galactopyranose mutase